MLIAEDLLLLLLDHDTGAPVVDGVSTDCVLAGAVLAELLQHGHVVQVDPGSGRGRAPRLVRRDGAPSGDDVLDRALRRLDEPHSGTKAVQWLGIGLRGRLLERLVVAGRVRRERRRVLGLFPASRFRGTHDGHEAGLRTGLADVLEVRRAPTSRELVLIVLLDAARALPRVLPDETAALGAAGLRDRVEAVGVDSEVPAEVRAAAATARAAVEAALEVVRPGRGASAGG